MLSHQKEPFSISRPTIHDPRYHVKNLYDFKDTFLAHLTRKAS